MRNQGIGSLHGTKALPPRHDGYNILPVVRYRTNPGMNLREGRPMGREGGRCRIVHGTSPGSWLQEVENRVPAPRAGGDGHFGKEENVHASLMGVTPPPVNSTLTTPLALRYPGPEHSIGA